MKRRLVGAQTFASGMRRMMKLRKVSIRKLSKDTEMDPANLRRIRSGQRSPNWATAVRIAAALGVSLDELNGPNQKGGQGECCRNRKSAHAVARAAGESSRQ